MEIINQTEEEISKATQRKITLEDTLEQVCWLMKIRAKIPTLKPHLLLSFNLLQG